MKVPKDNTAREERERGRKARIHCRKELQNKKKKINMASSEQEKKGKDYKNIAGKRGEKKKLQNRFYKKRGSYLKNWGNPDFTKGRRKERVLGSKKGV